MSATEIVEETLKGELERRIDKPVQLADGTEVKGSAFIAIILPAIVEVLQKILAGCNNTPQRAAKRLKKMGPWTRNNLRVALNSKTELKEVQSECYDSVEATVEAHDQNVFEALIEEEREERVEWSLF